MDHEKYNNTIEDGDMSCTPVLGIDSNETNKIENEVSKTSSAARKMNAHFCEFTDPVKGQCKQRAINGFNYCIRHILLDSNSPYKQCQHRRKPKNKHEVPVLCTNAIRASSSEIYCSTHLIMKGMKDPKSTQRRESKLNQQRSPKADLMDIGENNIPMSTQQQDTTTRYFEDDQHSSTNILMSNQWTSPPHNNCQQSQISPTKQSYLPSIPVHQQTMASDDASSVHLKNDSQFLSQGTSQSNSIGQRQIKSEIRASSDDSPINLINKAYPHLAAKLLQHSSSQKSLQKIDVQHERIETRIPPQKIFNDIPRPKIPVQQNIAPTSSLYHSQMQPETRIQHHPNFTNDGMAAFGVLSSPLYFLNNEPAPRHYDLDRIDQKLAATEAEDGKTKGIQTNVFSSTPIRKQKVIKLRQKRQKVHIDGVFRRIPAIDTMCRVVENYDFDRTDLFPLGLEPSDDEFSSDDSFPSFDEAPLEKHHFSSANNHSTNRLELYLLKKKLRLESARLVQRAKMCIPVNAAANNFPSSTGAALRIRKENKKKGNFIGKTAENRLRQCTYFSQQQMVRDGKLIFLNIRCPNFCLPWTCHCSEHISYNVSQQLFAYCKWRLCNTAVPVTDAILFDGYCRIHHQQQQKSGRFENPTPSFKHELPGRITSSQGYLPNRIQKNSMDAQMFDTYPGTSKDDHLNVVDGDVSLASVAQDLGFDGRELTDMLQSMPVEAEYEEEMEADEDNLLCGDVPGMSKDDSDEVTPGASIGHSWADVEQFLLEQEHNSISGESTSQF